jgi:two-component system sensor histidine kinase DegS
MMARKRQGRASSPARRGKARRLAGRRPPRPVPQLTPAVEATHVAIIGAGRGGTALLEIFANDPLVEIVGVAEINPAAPGLRLAKRLKVPVTRRYQDLLALESVDLVIDVSGDPDVDQTLERFHRSGVAVIGGASAKFMWELIEARIRATGEIEKALNRYQSLYRLYVKEAGAAVTEERTRIACEIHDGLVQSLAGVNFKLDLCQELAKKDPATCQDTLQETKQQLKLAIQEARQVILNLRPLHYDKLELIPAITNYLQAYETQSHIKSAFEVAGREPPLLPKMKMFLFRMVQEALSNVQKHAKASSVAVKLDATPAVITITVADDGVGFDAEAISRDPDKWDHFGLRGIVDRAHLIGGDARVESHKGVGTRITIRVPLMAKEGGGDGTDTGADR